MRIIHIISQVKILEKRIYIHLILYILRNHIYKIMLKQLMLNLFHYMIILINVIVNYMKKVLQILVPIIFWIILKETNI